MGPLERKLKKKKAEKNVRFATQALEDTSRKLRRIADKDLLNEVQLVTTMLIQLEDKITDRDVINDIKFIATRLKQAEKKIADKNLLGEIKPIATKLKQIENKIADLDFIRKS